VRTTFARRPLRRRIIALVAAYAIALASLIASFGAAQAAAETVDGETGIICHSDVAVGGPASTSHESNGTICFKTCIGCMTSFATIFPPAVATTTCAQLSFKRLDLPTLGIRLADTKSDAHRSRGPPPAL